jgi:hypothetical protein
MGGMIGVDSIVFDLISEDFSLSDLKELILEIDQDPLKFARSLRAKANHRLEHGIETNNLCPYHLEELKPIYANVKYEVCGYVDSVREVIGKECPVCDYKEV